VYPQGASCHKQLFKNNLKTKQMVTIIGYRLAKNKSEKQFICLELQGDVEMVQSLDTGKFYATARRASVTSTFTEETAKGLIGTRMPGVIKRVESDPYDYTVVETGEVIKLAHKYEFQPEGAPVNPVPERTFSLKRSLVTS
jgi:hypothetical protein